MRGRGTCWRASKVLSDKQREFLASCDHRWNVKTGATGSGKSWLDYVAVIPKRLLAMRGEGAAVILGNTQGTANRNILEPMREYWGGDLVGTISSDNSVKLFGRKVYVLGADNRKHVARIQGMTIEYAYGDEVTTWAEGVFQMLKSRLRCPHSHFDGTCNPDAPGHWFKKFLDSGADIYCQSSTIFDNPFLPREFVDNLCREYAGTVYYNRFILGQWVAAEGVIYRAFCDSPERFLVDGLPAGDAIRSAVIGVDFGGGTSAHAFCCVGFTLRGLVVVLDEYHEPRALDPAKLAEDFVDFARRCAARWIVTDVWCDSAEQTLINGLRAAAAAWGLRVNIGNALKRPINDRIRATCILMGAGRFFVARECRETINALQSALWDSRRATEDVRLDDGTTNIDSLDAMEYAFEREIPALIDGWRAAQPVAAVRIDTQGAWRKASEADPIARQQSETAYRQR